MEKASITSDVRTEDQEKQFRRMIEDLAKSAAELALKKVNPDKEGLQLMLGQGDEIGSEMNDFMIAQMQKRSVANQYADQQVSSSYGYLSGYTKPNPITDQIAILTNLFTDIRGVTAMRELADTELNPLAEGWCAIPDWHLIAPTYPQAVQKILDLIKKTRGRLYNYREGQIDDRHLRESKRSQRAWDMIRSSQPNCGILLVQAQFGLRHAGKSVLRALETMPYSYEFGLGAYANGVMILTHQNRLANYDDLWIDCAGDEWSWDADGSFGRAPLLFFDDEQVGFDASGMSDTSGRYGSSSAFLPQ